jgi:hypothetical protein
VNCVKSESEREREREMKSGMKSER